MTVREFGENLEKKCFLFKQNHKAQMQVPQKYVCYSY